MRYQRTLMFPIFLHSELLICHELKPCYIYPSKKLNKVVELVGGGCVINGAYPVYFLLIIKSNKKASSFCSLFYVIDLLDFLLYFKQFKSRRWDKCVVIKSCVLIGPGSCNRRINRYISAGCDRIRPLSSNLTTNLSLRSVELG